MIAAMRTGPRKDSAVGVSARRRGVAEEVADTSESARLRGVGGIEHSVRGRPVGGGGTATCSRNVRHA